MLIDEGFEGYLEADWLESVAGEVLFAQHADSSTELSLVIIGQERMRQLNSDYRGKDEPTDVLAFAMPPEPSEGEFFLFVEPPDGIQHLGEVIISYPQAVIQARERGHSVKRETAILIIHGMLHLLGHDHDKPEPERQMRAIETEILSRIEGELE